MISDALAKLARWRWACTVGLVAAACLPVAAATLLIPAEIAPPWGAHAGPLRLPSLTKSVRAHTASLSEVELETQTPMSPEVVAAAPTRAPMTTPTTASQPGATEGRVTRAPARSFFVPLGETDDSQPVELRGAARR
jgi:hypothetical protein